MFNELVCVWLHLGFQFEWRKAGPFFMRRIKGLFVCRMIYTAAGACFFNGLLCAKKCIYIYLTSALFGAR